MVYFVLQPLAGLIYIHNALQCTDKHKYKEYYTYSLNKVNKSVSSFCIQD